MKPRRLHSETTTSIFMDSPRLLLRLVLPHSWTRLASCCGSYCHIHGLASPPAAARTATFMDSPRLLLRLVRPHSCQSSAGGLEPSHFAQELGRARRLADETRDLGLQQRADLALAPA